MYYVSSSLTKFKPVHPLFKGGGDGKYKRLQGVEMANSIARSQVSYVMYIHRL